jgi:hypothetical protein
MPLSDDFTAVLQSNRTVALAAAFVSGTHHSDVLRWVYETVCDEPERPRAARRRARKSNGHRKPRGDRRLLARDEADERLIEAMRKNPEGVINDWVMVVGKSRTSVVTALGRLRDAGLAETREGRWRLCEEPAPRDPPARWIEPISAACERTRAHA